MSLLIKYFQRCSAAALLLMAAPYSVAEYPPPQKIYTPKERKIEEIRIRKDIEAKLDGRKRHPNQLDKEEDADRWLFGRLNESILLRQATGERFGIYESFDKEKNTRTFEIRLHKKNKVTDRFLAKLRSDDCTKDIYISADQITPKFIVHNIHCTSEYEEHTIPLLFDHKSRRFYDFGFDYDPTKSTSPRFTLKNGIYKLRWDTQFRWNDGKEFVKYNFKIVRNANSQWEVEDLPPLYDDNQEGSGIASIPKLPINPIYDLPAYVADWDKF